MSFYIIIIRLLFTKLNLSLNGPLVQREVNQQSEGRIWSGLFGRQWGHGNGAGGSASRKGNAEGGDPKTAGATAHASDRNTGEIL